MRCRALALQTGYPRHPPGLGDCVPHVPGPDTERFLSWIEAERAGEWMRRYTTPSLACAMITDGVPIDRRMRALYRDAFGENVAQVEVPPDPFAGNTDAFLAWLREPEPGSTTGGVSRYLALVRAERPELVAAFPDVPGSDEERYLAWVATEASQPGVDVPRALLP